MDIQETYRLWMQSPYFDEETKKELSQIAADTDEIADRFYRNLEFGTGGLRGIIGAGTNRMNIYTVRKATQGLANYIHKANVPNKSVAIAYDSRHKSAQFAQEAALCLAANGIKAHVFISLRPTPMLSSAVRQLGCTAGIAITASHNPAQYNGYKVYWEDGGQITPPRDQDIIKEVNAVTDFGQVKAMSKEDAVKAGLYAVIPDEIDDAYMQELKKLLIQPEVLKEQAGHLKIVYTPLHGTGNLPVRRILKELGFTQVYVVEEQELADGDFPTVSSPNPEDKDAFSLALALARQVDADIVLATDPDADRLGVYVKDKDGSDYISFTGNMSGVLIGEYLLREKQKMGALPEDSALVETIVTTDMLKAVAREYGAAVVEVLTGFKYIGEQIRFFEESRRYSYVFGMEESYGCLAGTYARDKDACVAVMLLCEVAAYHKKQGQTLWDAMLGLYERYGFYKEGLETVTLKGMDGAEKIRQRMRHLREEPPRELGGHKVLALRDYQADRRVDMQTGAAAPTGLPASDVLYYELEEDAWCCVRPSGTEPKIKYYFGVKGGSMEDADFQLERLKRDLL